MKFISLCSGIEAASVAFGPLGWQAIAFAEIEPFPCAVLAHHYPAVPNLGGITKFREWPVELFVEADVIVGGPPCQAFSVAGARQGLADARGNLTLVYAEIINHADRIRKEHGKPAIIVIYENVPGLLSSKDNAFGCLLGALAGEDGELVAPGAKWTNAGCVFGPERAITWRVTDAQYFFVAQRRARVFVVASAREGFDPAEVLFEFDGVRRDSAPSREAREETAGTLTSSLGVRRGQPDCGSTSGQLQPVRLGGPAVEVCPTLRAGGNSTGGDRPPGTDVGTCDSLVICMATGQGGAEVLTELAPTLTLTCNHEAPIGAYSVSLRGRDGGGTAELGGDLAQCLRASGGGGGGDKPHVLTYSFKSGQSEAAGGVFTTKEFAPALQAANNGSTAVPAVAYAFDSRQDPVSSPHVFGALGSSSPQAQAVAFQSSQSGVRLSDTHATLDANNGSRRHNGVLAPVCITGDVTHTLKAEGFDASEDGTGRGQPIISYGWAVRRLMPVECERLQAFPDNYTLIPVKKAKKRSAMYDYAEIDGELWQLAADGPRYKALGNSMCVNNMRWIGQRIAQHLACPYADLL